MTSYRTAVALIVAIDVAIAVRIALLWDRLPSLMASHFGVSGVANGWMPRTQFFGFMAAVAGGTSVVFAVSGWFLRLVPANMINLPNRDYWLSPDRRESTINRMAAWMSWFGVALAAFLAFVLELTLRANLARAPIANGPLLFALGAYLVVVLLSIVELYRRFRVPTGNG